MSLSGMTGFARIEGQSGDWSWSIEARSVNGRNLETRFKGPQGFDGLERTAREAAQTRFQRGQVNIGLQARRAETQGAVRLNQETLDRYLALSSELVKAGRASPPAADGLLALKGVLEAGEEAEDPEVRATVEAAMAESLMAALDALKASRLKEGAALAPLLGGMLQRIAALIADAEREATAQVSAIRDRFTRRLSELVGDTQTLEDRIVQEAAVLAAKADVREELDRLTAHVGAARDLIAQGSGAGRRLDFLSQEFMREANTLCSKSATTSLTATGLELKAVIEQLREQIQTVE
jgi:uncharacterized protein (TIGR00255 family)